jgi:hypothetical protein
MNPGNAGGDELQKAIDAITNASKPAEVAAPVAGGAPAFGGGAGGMAVVQPLATAGATVGTGATADVSGTAPFEPMKSEPNNMGTMGVVEGTVVSSSVVPEVSNVGAMAGGASGLDMGAMVGGTGLDDVKKSALNDLKPILDKVDLSPEDKFRIYREILDGGEEREVIEPAYNAAKQIADDKARAEALLFIIQKIDEVK